MADKTYKMQVTLTDNRVLDAGTFVAPQGPQGPQGPKGESGGSRLLANLYCDLSSGNVTMTISNGGIYYSKRATNGTMTQGGSDTIRTLTFDDNEYNIIVGAPIGTGISIDDEEGQIEQVVTITNNTLIKKTPSFSDGMFYLTIIANYNPLNE